MNKVCFTFCFLTLFTYKVFAEQNHIEQQLSSNLYQLNAQSLSQLLETYRKQPDYNPRLAEFAEGRIAFLKEDYSKAINLYRQVLAENPDLNPVRIELATVLFIQKEDKEAQRQFELARADSALPESVKATIAAYLEKIQQRNRWNFDFSINYVRDSNVNNVANAEHISLSNHSKLTKSGRLLPQTAHGIHYNLNISRDFNLWHSHYISVGNRLSGKNYWDNHSYDDISNRTSLGYAYKSAYSTFRVKPFYEKRWYGNKSYRWNQGVNTEISYWLNANWQLNFSTEFAHQRYFDDFILNGNNKHISATAIWLPNSDQMFYLGSDFFAERTQIRQYDSDGKTIRIGWGQEWQWGISSQIHFSAMKRTYKDIAKLGNLNFFSFGKIREDKVYTANLLLWKRDWHLWGITPKIQFLWRKQDSNIPEMYSYSQRNVNLLFEKSF